MTAMQPSAQATAPSTTQAQFKAWLATLTDGFLAGLFGTDGTTATARSKLGIFTQLFNNRGAWSSSNTYAIGDYVTDSGVVYVAINAVGPSATHPGSDTTNWQLVQGITTGQLASASVGSGADLIANCFRKFDTVADMRTGQAPLNGVGIAATTGQNSPGDGMGRFYEWNNTSTATDDGYITVKLASVATGRYIAMFPINKTDLGMIDYGNEVNHDTTGGTGATLTSADMGKSHLFYSAGGNVTVNLPTPVGLAGQIICVRFRYDYNGLATVSTPSGSIDGQTSRVMWANESACLRSDGVNWSKIAGKTVPFQGFLQANASQTYTGAGSMQTVTFGGGAFGDPTGLNLWNNASTFKAPRYGTYSFDGYLSITASSGLPGNQCQAKLTVTSGTATLPATIVETVPAAAATRAILKATAANVLCQPGAVIALQGLVTGSPTSPSFEYNSPNVVASLSFTEVPAW